MIRVICICCQKELNEPGALFISPPQANHTNQVKKVHLCVGCYKVVREFTDKLATRAGKQETISEKEFAHYIGSTTFVKASK